MERVTGDFGYGHQTLVCDRKRVVVPSTHARFDAIAKQAATSQRLSDVYTVFSVADADPAALNQADPLHPVSHVYLDADFLDEHYPTGTLELICARRAVLDTIVAKYKLRVVACAEMPGRHLTSVESTVAVTPESDGDAVAVTAQIAREFAGMLPVCEVVCVFHSVMPAGASA